MENTVENDDTVELELEEEPITAPIKKKRVPTQKQLDALQRAREKRALNKIAKDKEIIEKQKKIKPKAPTTLNRKNPAPKAIVKKPKKLIEDTVEEEESYNGDDESLEDDLSDIEEEPLNQPISPPPKRVRKKIIRVVKRKKSVSKKPKEIVYENSSSESDDDELLQNVYTYYKKELRGKKQAKLSSVEQQEPSYTPQHFNLNFV